MKKVLIAEDNGVLYVFETLYDYCEFVKKYKTIHYELGIYEYEVVNDEGLMIKYKKL